jgi:gluconolactonase
MSTRIPAARLLAAAVLAFTSAVQAQSAPAAPAAASVTPAIAGVVAAGTPITLVRDGFDGTEGPLPLADGSLLFTENRADRVIRIAPDGAISTYLERANSINALAAGPKGELYGVQTQQPRVGIVHPAGQEKVLADQYQGQPFSRPNDLVLAANGTLYFTDSGSQLKPGEKPPQGHPGVYRLPAGGTLERIAGGSEIARPNGVQLSPDEKTLYVANTAGDQVLAWDIGRDGKLGARRDFAKLSGLRDTDTGPSSGADGLAVDGDGRLYVATTDGVQVFSAKGQALGTIVLPKAPQNLAFGGRDKKTLYVVGRGAVYTIATLSSGYRGRAK